MEPSGTCVGCFRETDTGTGFVGPVAFAVAALVTVGVEQEVAVKMVSAPCRYDLGCPPGTVPNEDITYRIRLCSACAKGYFPVGPIAEGVPLPGARVPNFRDQTEHALPPDCRTGAVTRPCTCVHDRVSSQRYIEACPSPTVPA